jgi:phosphoribosylanthranilate isomerase
MPMIKICGMTTYEDALMACEAGADAVGFISYPLSPRFIQPQQAAEIAEKLPKQVLKVLVGVNMTDEERQKVQAVWEPDIWQMHGTETPQRVQALAFKRSWKALGLPLAQGLNPADYQVEALLLDKASPLHGGTGQSFDWDLALELKKTVSRPVILSGGLHPKNVVEAIRKVQPWGVDVCSGVEAAPGKKNPDKVKEFIRLCRSL